MSVYFYILISLIFIFILGNLILIYLENKKQKILPINSKNINSTILDSKIDVLHKRVSYLEDKLRFRK